MKKKYLIPLFIVLVLAAFIYFGRNVGYSYDSQWCTNCGLIRHVTTRCNGFTCTTSERIDNDNYFSIYWEKTHGECEEHSWRNFHGGAKFLLKRYTYSGSYPFWFTLGQQFDYLDFIYENDSELAREVMDHMLYIEKQRIIDEEYDKEQYDELLQFNQFLLEEDFNKFKDWWQSYKEKYNL